MGTVLFIAYLCRVLLGVLFRCDFGGFLFVVLFYIGDWITVFGCVVLCFMLGLCF